MEKEQRRELNNLCFKMGIAPDQAINLMENTNFNITIEALYEVEGSQNDLLTKPVLFKRIAARRVTAYNEDSRNSEQSKAYIKMVEQWQASQDRGFKATKEQLAKQLLDLHESRSLQTCLPRNLPKGFEDLDFEVQDSILLKWGMKGIGVAIANVPDPTDESVIEADGDIPVEGIYEGPFHS